jgi:hypothetical protein
MEEIGKSNLSTEDRTAFIAGAMRAALSKDYTVDGKTVDQVITEQKTFAAAQAVREAAEKAAREKEEQRLAALREQMSTTLHVFPLSKTFVADDPANGVYGNAVNLRFQIENHGSKQIRAFKGTTTFVTDLGEKLQSVTIAYDNSVAAHATVRWDGHIDLNRFEDNDTKFGQLPLSRLHFTFVPERIVFEDGSKLIAENASP